MTRRDTRRTWRRRGLLRRKRSIGEARACCLKGRERGAGERAGAVPEFLPGAQVADTHRHAVDAQPVATAVVHVVVTAPDGSAAPAVRSGKTGVTEQRLVEDKLVALALHL